MFCEKRKYKPININNIGITPLKTSELINNNILPPKTEPMKVVNSNNLLLFKLTIPFLIKYNEATNVPLLPCNLLVANATEGGIPSINIVGMVINPPPPAIVSTQPARVATKNSNISI